MRPSFVSTRSNLPPQITPPNKQTPTGVRLGSVVAPTAEDLARLKAKQVPWSVNCVALVRNG